MSNPADAGREVFTQENELVTASAPGDNETSALVREPGDYASLDVDNRDPEALDTSAALRRRQAMMNHPAFARNTIEMGTTRADRVTISRQWGAEVAGIASNVDGLDTFEVAGHVVGNGPEREITANFRQQYGHMAVALAGAHARAVLEEDIEGERRAKALLDTELASLRKDFAEWEAGLHMPKSDEHFEATGITSDFNILDRPYLPVTLTSVPEDSAGSRTLSAPEPHQAEVDSQSAADASHNLFSWLDSLSDEQLVNYFQWSEHRTSTVTEALASQRGEIEQNIRRDFEHLITDGLAPECARVALEQSFNQTAIFGVLSAFESGFYQAAGIFDTDSRRLGVHREYSTDEIEKYTREMHWVFMHESLHAYDAATNTGLTYLLSTEEEPLTWVDEAVKQHLAEAGMNGQPTVLDPNARYVEGVYKDIRELLHLTLTAGEIDITIREVTAANFERHDADESQQARVGLVNQLRESYRDILPDLPQGETILHVIARDINAAPKPLSAQVIQDWIHKVSEWRDEKLANDMALAY